ncbi:transposase, partial [Kribbella sp. VKM Ac-2568]
MANSYRPVDRDQAFLLPPNMADWLPEGHLAWFVIDAVKEMDTAAFHAGRARSGQGRAAYDPDMLVTLLLYAYAHKVHSSRQIERLCTVDVAFRVICAQDVPDHSTISTFRREHEAAFKALFEQVLMLCARAG